MSILAKIRRKAVNAFKRSALIPQNIWFAYQNRHLRQKCKIIYALTPPPELKNVGDQAQAIAINAWLRKNFPSLPILEVNKQESKEFMPALKWLIQPEDLIFLHSGGNLGDRGIWSESIRRLIIINFSKNKIVSLPQTIYFSDTPTGIKERENTRRIYANHPNLTVMGRDLRSGELAAELFPKAKTFCMPDFVLSMSPRESNGKNNPLKVLLCLRLDDESALTPEQREEIANRLPYQCSYYDTTIDEPIAASQRETFLENTLKLFQSNDAVVTDRYHGLIFAIICRKPCVVLPTVDHKLTSAIDWFKDVPFVIFAHNIEEIPSLVDRCLMVENRVAPDWNKDYFDKIPAMIGLN